MTERVVLHVDMNAFYASVEQHKNPSLRGRPIAVAGNPERRNGIILAKSREAKACGVKTAEALWQAKEKCPDIIFVPPDYRSYLRYSRFARQIYYQYSDQVEPFGLDESWIELTHTLHLHGGDAMLVAEEISERIKAELGLTVSVGVSFNKVFAKFGSDTDPGDGIMRITPRNFRSIVWPHPVDELIYVGRATKSKLNSSAVFTIGDLACASDTLLQRRLGKMGGIIKMFANGQDISPVKVMDPAKADADYAIKSIGNGLTAPHDLVTEREAKALIYLLSESVAQRLRECRMRARTIAISVRGHDLLGYTRQAPLPAPSNITEELSRAAFALLRANEPLDRIHPVRALGVRACNLVSADLPVQEDLFGDVAARESLERLDATIDDLRRRFGNGCVKRMVELSDEAMAGLDIKRDNIIHPVGFFAPDAHSRSAS
ncbi:DNA polymerase IV [Slackia heliotrinireducens]|uniref:DNA polymerase IV n=1 Tax=Slackia heliotrinireducens (strain ATCC 29202 / DSM 20476 / NCTC 11029 / RHS 1) TaxID=471855 RepID=C7N106_SLAHD|nr:DNA polymerase IV [Slackia heliotrinireducens]ACV23228.1 nucleotidyltransferase/DNA polymerase involved in DNA repair [Slackia heliotrinireducens DSM 20476]VEH02349.1 DNA polymerase IV [Slackia heliotrinireducens]